MFYGHSNTDDKEKWELLITHLHNVAQTCENFSAAFGCEKLGRLAGLLHDLGKYSPEFQKRLDGELIKVDHSTAGAVEAINLYNNIGVLLAYVVAGHHAGLPNYGNENESGSLAERKIKDIPDYSAYKEEVEFEKVSFSFPERFKKGLDSDKKVQNYEFYLLIKMLFSCLVDADYLETEKFLDLKKYQLRKQNASIEQLAEMFNNYMSEKALDFVENQLNQNRTIILNSCKIAAQKSSGIFTLTVPTGGGKTLSSMAFALEHAKQNNLNRIIYVIPYTSIIEQTAAIFKDIFGIENVLEHHSNFDFMGEFSYENSIEPDVEKVEESIKLASENWDLPIIVTTNVQFFESIYSNKSSKSRKLHNLAKSVVIFDEAQMLPIDYLKPALECICELVERYEVSAVLCTATQPAIKEYLRKGIPVTEIVGADKYNKEVFKRVEFEFVGKKNNEELVAELTDLPQALCVVSTKKKAKELFEKLPEENRYHLSGNMCPEHRKNKLKEIKNRLKNKEDVRVITTQLIEAGVDIDFPVVYREIAGIDSVIQAAGRCNREGNLEKGKVVVFTREGKLPDGYLSRAASYGAETMRIYEDVDSDEAIKYYFELLFTKEKLDKKEIMSQITDISLKYPFKTISEKFKLIESNTVSVIVPYNEEARELIAKLPYERGAAARRLQKYTVNVYGSSLEDKNTNSKSEYQILTENGGITVVDNIYNILNYDEAGLAKFYSEEVGIVFDGYDDVLIY